MSNQVVLSWKIIHKPTDAGFRPFDIHFSGQLYNDTLGLFQIEFPLLVMILLVCTSKLDGNFTLSSFLCMLMSSIPPWDYKTRIHMVTRALLPRTLCHQVLTMQVVDCRIQQC